MSDSENVPNLYRPKYWPLWFGIALLRLLAYFPWSWRMATGRAMGRLAQRLSARRARITRVNLDLCFPRYSAEERQRMVRRHAESIGMGIMDTITAWWASDQEIDRLISIHGRENVDRAFAQGRGVIFLTAHFTSVEMSGRITCRFGNVLPMYRPNKNPLLQQVITRSRERHVEKVIPRDNVRLMLRTLKANKGVWFAPDQNFGHKNSLFSPFFGIPAATNTSTSRFAEMTGARVVPFVTIRREQAPGYDMYIEPPLEDFPSGDLQKDTDRINAIFERWIRKAPTQYLWSHRRFKDRPNGEPGFY